MDRISKRILFSYVFDWVIIIAASVAGVLFSQITPNKHPFSLADPGISFPYVHNSKISTPLLIALSVGVPVVVILVVCFFFIPGPAAEAAGSSRLRVWRRKAWELHIGFLGLGLSVASTFLLTNGSKNMFGKPRPDLLSRCQPDLANISMYTVGGVGDRALEGIVLVSAAICKNPDVEVLDDGFRSFPSGHSSIAWAGLTYLTLFLAAKFSITIPYLASRPSSPTASRGRDLNTKLRSQAAAPPLYLLIVALIPIAVAIYISSTRYSDFRHHGFDVLFGSLLGFVCAWFAFRWYHLPITRGAGYAWGARSRSRAFGIGIGVGSYAGGEESELGGAGRNPDLESGAATMPSRAGGNTETKEVLETVTLSGGSSPDIAGGK